jgi:hypothetical protein
MSKRVPVAMRSNSCHVNIDSSWYGTTVARPRRCNAENKMRGATQWLVCDAQEQGGG